MPEETGGDLEVVMVWNPSDSAVAGAKTLDHSNPQTQETSFPLMQSGK